MNPGNRGVVGLDPVILRHLSVPPTLTSVGDIGDVEIRVIGRSRCRTKRSVMHAREP